MAEKTLKARFELLADTYENWHALNPVLRNGEPCFVVVPVQEGGAIKEPAILMKKGDGTSDFRSLPFLSAIAADVYDWAKASVKPAYSAREISGLEDFINDTVVDTNTTYKLEQDAESANIIKLYHKDANGEWALDTTLTISDPEMGNRMTAVESAISTLNGTGAGSVAKQVSDAVAQIVNGAPEAYDTLKELSDWISSHSGDAAEMNSAIQQNAADISSLESGKVDKIDGKGLSTNDYTTSEKSKLGGIAAGAQVNVIEEIHVNGAKVSPTGKTVDISISEVGQTGNINDLIQTEGDVIIFNCGTASAVV